MKERKERKVFPKGPPNRIPTSPEIHPWMLERTADPEQTNKMKETNLLRRRDINFYCLKRREKNPNDYCSTTLARLMHKFFWICSCIFAKIVK